MKKKTLLVIALICVCRLGLFAQDDKNIAFAYGFEVNKYAIDGLAYGALLVFNLNLPARFAAGITITGSGSSYGNSAIEPSLMARYYFSDTYTGFFVQADAGMVLIQETEKYISPNNKHMTLCFMGGIRGGYRLHFGQILYAEPYIRGGYPFIFGAGIILGYRY